MRTVYSPRHAGHAGNMELNSGAIVPAYELPRRAEIIRARVAEVGLGPILPPTEHDLSTAKRVHAADYIDFLPRVWPLWAAAGRTGTAMPFVWPVRGLRGDVAPTDIDGLLGYYSMDAGATFVAGTWDAVKSSHDVALTAAALVGGGEPAAFALCRPPGHHAGPGFMGGYCFINNAAVAAEWLRGQGAGRVSILDIDYHHGNGTQAIFYDRADVQVVNIHADPLVEYPYFLGHADERGAGDGIGFNLNLPLPTAVASPIGARRSTPPAPRWRRSIRISGGVAGGGYLSRRPDQPVQARHARLSPDRRGGRRPRPAHAVRDGGRLRRRGHRAERGRRADRLRGPLTRPIGASIPRFMSYRTL